MTLKQIALSIGIAAALIGSHASAQNPEKDNAFAMQLAAACDTDKNGMVTKAEYLKMMESKWDQMSKGAKEITVANTAKIFMDPKQVSH